MIERTAIQALADEIASKFDVERIILFGSYAYGTPTEDSDVDLLVLMNHDGRDRDVSLRISNSIAHAFSRDIIVRSPSDAWERYSLWDPLIRHAFDRGKVLYESSGQRVAS